MKPSYVKWTGGDGCQHQKFYNSDTGMWVYSIGLVLPLVKREVKVVYQFPVGTPQRAVTRMMSRSKLRLAKLARLDYHRHAKKLEASR